MSKRARVICRSCWVLPKMTPVNGRPSLRVRPHPGSKSLRNPSKNLWQNCIRVTPPLTINSHPLPSFRRKMTMHLKEMEESLAGAQSKLASMEKTKNRIASELEDVNLDLEKVHWNYFFGSSELGHALFSSICRNGMQLLHWRRSRRRLTSKLLNGRTSVRASSKNWMAVALNPELPVQRLVRTVTISLRWSIIAS